MDTVVIRPGRAEDEKDIQEFTTHTFDWGDYVAEAYSAWIEEMGRGEGDVYVAVSMPSGQAVGVTHARYLSPEEAWFEGIRVHPDFRRAGIGRLLTVAAIEGARRRGIQICRAAIDGDNMKSQGLARNYGFEPVVPIVQHEAPLGQMAWSGPVIASASARQHLCLRDATADDTAAVFTAVSREMAYMGSDYTWWRVTPANVGRVIAQRRLRLAVDAGGQVVAGAALSEPFLDENSVEPVAYGEMSSPFGDWAGVMAIAQECGDKTVQLAAGKGAPGKLSIICEARSPITSVLLRHGFTERFLEDRRDEIWLWELLLDPEAIVR